MLDTELAVRLEQLLLKRLPPPAARRKAAELTARIRDQLHPIAVAASRGRSVSSSQLGCYQQRTLGRLGAGSSAASSAVSYGALGAKVGTAAIPIPIVGTVVGAAVGLVAGYLIGNKHYIDVNTDNADEDQDALDIWPQYRRVAGTVAGRDIGLPLLERIWKGAVFAGEFPKNNQKLCFHNGCLKYPGNPQWVTNAIFNRCKDSNCWPDLMPKALASGIRDPGQIVDSVWIPAQTGKPPWAIPTTPAGRQILVDIADAYLAQSGAPYTYGTPQQSAALPQQIAPAAPAVPAAPVALPASPLVPQPVVSAPRGAPDDALLQALLQQQAGLRMNSGDAQQLLRDVSTGGVQATPGGPPPITAGLAGVPTWLAVGGAVLAVGFALATPVGKSRPRAHA